MKIISGGQTGVDRGALDAAIALGVPHGGWCPRGRTAEDGHIPDRYQLRETDSADDSARTEQNVLGSHATLVLHRGQIAGGTELTIRLAERHRRPFLAINLDAEPNPAEVFHWLVKHRTSTLNVAGPRESQSPGIETLAHDFIARVLAGS